MVKRRQGRRANLTIELVAALGVLTAVVIPYAFSVAYEIRLCRVNYHRAVAMEIVDGEMEVLAAGEWRSFQPGTHSYTVQAAAAKNLPPGRFLFTMNGRRVQLEWLPERSGMKGVRREVTLP